MRRRRKNQELTRLSKLLDRVYPAREQLHQVRVYGWWQRAIPERVVNNARPVHLKKGVLIVHVSSTVWANELHYFSDDFIKRIRAFAPEAGVHTIHYRVGALPPRTPARPVEPEVTPIEVSAIPEEVARALSRIHDDSLRDTVLRAVCASMGSKPSE